MTAATCVWCGRDAAAGFCLHDPRGERSAAFCRLEHVVAWSLRGSGWQEPVAPRAGVDEPSRCARCDARLHGATRLLLVRMRGAVTIADAFCSHDHLLAWARAGGRYARSNAPAGNADAPGA